MDAAVAARPAPAQPSFRRRAQKARDVAVDGRADAEPLGDGGVELGE